MILRKLVRTRKLINHKKKSQRDDEKEDTDGKSENTAVQKRNSTKDMEPKLNSGNIVSKSDSRKGDEMADDKEPPAENALNDDYNGEEGQSQDIDTAQDNEYRTENDTDTRNE